MFGYGRAIGDVTVTLFGIDKAVGGVFGASGDKGHLELLMKAQRKHQ